VCLITAGFFSLHHHFCTWFVLGTLTLSSNRAWEIHNVLFSSIIGHLLLIGKLLNFVSMLSLVTKTWVCAPSLLKLKRARVPALLPVLLKCNTCRNGLSQFFGVQYGFRDIDRLHLSFRKKALLFKDRHLCHSWYDLNALTGDLWMNLVLQLSFNWPVWIIDSDHDDTKLTYWLGYTCLILCFGSCAILDIQFTYMTINGKCIAHWFFKILKILNTKFQHTFTIEMYCVENRVCVVLWACTHRFQDPKEPET
jgi:hypothetical protein